MKLSVVLPVYNAEKTIESAVNSILCQSFTAYELIVINDGSNDSTPDVLKKLENQDQRLKVYHLNHRGISRALNFAIKVSKGEYIARMDADDFSYPQRLQKQYNYLEKHPDVGLVSSLVHYNGDVDKNEGYARYVKWINSITTPEQILLKRFQESPFAHPSICFRRKLVMHFGGYAEGNIPEDYELWLRWLQHGVLMHKINEYLLDWRDGANRLSRISHNYSSDRFYEVKAHYFHLFFKQHFTTDQPEIWIWGAGRVANSRVKHLIFKGVTISKYIDVKERPNDARQFIHFSKVPKPRGLFILCFVGDRIGKIKIFNYLIEKGYQEGINFLMMA